MKPILFVLLIFIGSYCFGQATVNSSKSGWTAVYSHDENGKGTFGDKQNLIKDLRKGYSLRVSWSWTRQVGDSLVTLEHFADPIFVTIIQEKNVSAIINPHPLLKSYLDISQQQFDKPTNTWQCILTTKGTFNAVVYSQSTGEIIKDWPQRHKMTWYLEYP